MRFSVRATVAVALVAGLLSIAATVGARASAVRERDARVVAEAEQMRAGVQQQLQHATDVAVGLRNALTFAQTVDRDTFAALVELDRSAGLLDSVRAASFVRSVPAADVAAYEREQRRLVAQHPGYPSFSVTPADATGAERFIVEMIEPVTGNEAALGFDLGSNSARRAALEAARDRGEPAATEPIVLVQDGDGAATLLAMAVYDTPQVPQTAPGRRRHIVGFVTLVLNVETLVDDVVIGQAPIDVAIIDLGDTADRPLDRDDARWHLVTTGSFVDVASPAAIATDRLDLNVGGRRWGMFVRPSSGAPDAAWRLPALVALIGLVATALLVQVSASGARARRRAEALVEARTAELRQLIDHAPDATVVVDQDGVITTASRQVRAVLGYEPEALVGRSVEELLPDASRSGHVALREDFTEHARQAKAMAREQEVEALHADGRTIPVEVSLNPLPPPPDNPSAVQVIASIRDVSERRETARRVAELNDQKSVFMRTVSHELGTPLTAIEGFVDVLQRFGTKIDADTTADYLARIRRNTTSLTRLIGEIIDFTKLDREQTATLVPIELGMLTKHVVEQLGPVLASHEVQVTVGNAVMVEIDPAGTTRIVTNLLTNAVRYSPDATTITVTVTQDLEEGVGIVAVEDAGPGIAEADRERIFERFWRGDGDHVLKAPGTGIGLAVVRELTEAQGGRVTVGTSPAGGASFTVRLPLSGVPS